ncbi:unnamed protein product [Urochloa decumbens]|uniref:F-box/LRR-repeat protein 15/At3g58940/PEG3-like LRR domain-containing protein n=1 Tax=Urochloa decumbens TaxID=240449 RepID=A0ABC9AL49_9POAL
MFSAQLQTDLTILSYRSRKSKTLSNRPPLMDQDRPRRRRRRHRRHRRRSGEDHISGHPDELLHTILLHLGSARAAARTCVLSRRWRPVWVHLPELVFGNASHDAPPPTPTSFLDAVDSALSAYAAPTLEALVVVMPTAASHDVPAGRVAPWLRFAAERVAGDLVLFMPSPRSRFDPIHELEVDYWQELSSSILLGHTWEGAVLELPTCERAKTITLRLKQDWRLRLWRAGAFAALASLRILCGCMEGSELTALVCTQCPYLKELRLCVTLVDASDVSIRSDSLQSLSFSVKGILQLEVVTPRLEYLCVGEATNEARYARISAPKLERVVWCVDTYDPHQHRFEGVGRRLRLLDVCGNFIAGLLMQRFDKVDELQLGIYIPRAIAAYERFLKETNKLPKCETMNITLESDHKGLAPVMLHLLRSSSRTKKVSVQLIDGPSDYASWCSCQPSCPCRFKENNRIDGIDLNSLEEIEITSYKIFGDGLFKFVDQLSRCNVPILKRFVLGHRMFSVPSQTKLVCEKIHSMYSPKIEVECYDFLDGMWVRVD